MTRSIIQALSGPHFRQLVATWGMRIVLAFIISMIVLTHLHILPAVIHNLDFYLALVVSVLWFLSEILNEWHRDMFSRLDTQKETLNGWRNEMSHRLDAQKETLDVLQKSLRAGTELLTLERSTEDLLERLKTVEPGRKVIIEHFGLDMTVAWDKILEMFEALPNVTDLEYRLLLMSPEGDNLDCYDNDVRGWMVSGRNQVIILTDRLKALRARCEKENRTFVYDIRTYSAVPMVHGFRVLEPFDAAYIAMCRWAGEECNEYRWGGSAYQQVLDTSRSDARGDLLEIFRGNFRHFWDCAPQARERGSGKERKSISAGGVQG